MLLSSFSTLNRLSEVLNLQSGGHFVAFVWYFAHAHTALFRLK